MKASAAVEAVADGQGRTVLRDLRSEGPLALRETPTGLYLVGAAAGPLGGDDLRLQVTVGPGAHLVVRSAAAALALPGAVGAPSLLRIEADVSGTLDWMPEPVVACGGCRHTQATTLRLGAGARLRWREEIVLGRHGEVAGTYVSDMTVRRMGHTLLRQQLALGPGFPAHRSPAVIGDAGATGSILVVDPAWEEQPWESEPPRCGSGGPEVAVLGLAGPGVQVCAVAPGAAELRRMLEGTGF